MRYEASHLSIVGPVRQINEDSLCYRQAVFMDHEIIMAVICDGMGGLERGEVASASVVRSFYEWFEDGLDVILKQHGFTEEVIINEWRRLIGKLNVRLRKYGERKDMALGTTLSAIIVYRGKYVIGHVGDSRIYHIGLRTRQLTQDQSMGPGSNVLLECIGGSDKVTPYFVIGKVNNGMFLLCSDGFWHRCSKLRIFISFFSKMYFCKHKNMENEFERLVKRCVARGETDNISVLGVNIVRRKAGR